MTTLLAIVLAAEHSSGLSGQTINTMITVAGTVAVAIIGGTFAILQAHRKKASDEVTAPASMPPSPLANFSGTQNEFMSLVIEDNQLLRNQMRELMGRVSSAEQVAESAQAAAREMRELHTEFQRAVRRYLEDVANAWTGENPMPYPNENDRGLLEHTLPRLRRRSQ